MDSSGSASGSGSGSESKPSVFWLVPLAMLAIVTVAILGVVFVLVPGVCLLLAADCVADGVCELSTMQGTVVYHSRHVGLSAYVQGALLFGLALLVGDGGVGGARRIVAFLRSDTGGRQTLRWLPRLAALAVYLLVATSASFLLARWIDS